MTPQEIARENLENVRLEILDIMDTYHEQERRGSIDTPGGLEHMGDVWELFLRWEGMLRETKEST